MREQLVLFYTPGQDAIEGQLLNGAAEPMANAWHGRISDLATLVEGRDLVVIVPSEPVVLLNTRLPVTRLSKAVNAVPYMLEDQLLEEVESLHFAVGGTAGEVDVATVSREQMDQWTEAFGQYDLQPQRMVPDVLAVPLQGGSWSLWREEDRVLIRTGHNQGWACEPGHLRLLLQQALSRVETKPVRLQVYDARSDANADPALELQGLDETIESVDVEKVTNPRLTLAQTVVQVASLNLLQGGYRFRQSLEKLIRPWRYSLMAVAAIAVLAILGALLDYLSLSLEKSRIESRIESLVQQNFPEIKNINFYQLESRLRQQQSRMQQEGIQEGYFYLTGAVGRIVLNYPDIQIQTLNYEDNQLQLSLAYQQRNTLDELVARLRNLQGLSVAMQVEDESQARIEVKQK